MTLANPASPGSIANPANPASPLYDSGTEAANQTAQNATQAAINSSQGDPVIGTLIAMFVALAIFSIAVYS